MESNPLTRNKAREGQLQGKQSARRKHTASSCQRIMLMTHQQSSADDPSARSPAVPNSHLAGCRATLGQMQHIAHFTLSMPRLLPCTSGPKLGSPVLLAQICEGAAGPI
jgi:hypothetical protein